MIKNLTLLVHKIFPIFLFIGLAWGQFFDSKGISFGIGFPLSSNILINATLVNSNWDKISSDTYAPSEAIESVSAKKIFINTAYLF